MKPTKTPARKTRRSEGTSEPASAEAAVRVLRQFRIIFNAVKTHFQQVERSAGIGGAQVWALSIIRDHPGIGVNGLAVALNVRQPTASNLVRSLSQQNLIEVRREGPDRRAVQLYATAEGRKVVRRAPGPVAGVLPEALAAMDPESLQDLEQQLALLISHLGADERGATIPLSQV